MKNIILCVFAFCIMVSAQDIGARYLIITHDNFYDAVLPLAEWKHKKGMKCIVKRLSEIGSTQNQIHDYIVDAYNTWTIPLEYVLFVGAPNFLPFPTISGVYTDNYYTDIDGDVYNDILPGRLTVHSTTEAQTVVNKILRYERTPFMLDSLWFKKATLIVRRDMDPPDDSIYFSDAFFAAECMVNTGFVEIDTFSDMYGNTVTDLLNATNEGRSIIMYRGSGMNNWPPPFNIDPNVTNNGAKLPIVLSITCRTMGTGSTAAVAERWLLTGTPTEPRGGSGFFATTTAISGGAHLRSAVAKGFHDALFNNNDYTFGKACEGGRMRVYTMYPYQGGLNEYRGYTTLGDPEMNIWTATPCVLTVDHPAVVPAVPRTYIIHVARAHDMSPVDNAVVCAMSYQDTTVYTTTTTDPAGNAYVTIYPHYEEDTVFVTVTGKNLHPYEGWMEVIQEGAYIMYLSSVIDDSLGGDNNGMINPGETINLPLWVANVGDSTAYGVYGILRSEDNFATITDSVKTFGDIAGNDSAFTGTDGYEFSANTACPDGHAILFELECRDMNDSVYFSSFYQYIYAPALVFYDAIISGGNGNSTLEAGETVFVCVSVHNQGSVAADSLNAVLSTTSPYVEITDSLGFYAHIGPDTTASNDNDLFTVISDSTTPQGTIAGFHMTMTGHCFIDTVSFLIPIGKKNYFIWNPDITPSSGETIHGLLMNLNYNGNYSTTLSTALYMYKIVFVCVGVWPNNYVIHENSPEAAALVNFADNGGRLYLEGGDVWYFDPQTNNGYDFASLFGLNAVADGIDNMGPLDGQPATFTQGMYFTYPGENQYMDHISPSASGSFAVFHDANDNFDCGIAYDAGYYKTIGFSFELGGLADGTPPSTRAVLIDSIMHFFGVYAGIEEQINKPLVPQFTFTVFPNPARRTVAISYSCNNLGAHTEDKTTITIYDISGRQVKKFMCAPATHPYITLMWNGQDDKGREVPEGVYFVHLRSSIHTLTQKIIFLH
jgi:hypothetical protein